jgi:hypothetical protein
MSETNKSKNDGNIKDVRPLLDYYSGYHHHKENMAYVGLGVQIAIFSWIMVTDKWPLEWYGQCRTQWLVWIANIFLWLLIHWFVGWQLLKRRYAAKVVGAYILYEYGHIFNKQKTCLKTYKFRQTLPIYLRKLFDCIQILWAITVWPCGGVETVSRIIRPSKFARLVKGQRPGTWKEEFIFFVGSIIMAILIFNRTCNGYCR